MSNPYTAPTDEREEHSRYDHPPHDPGIYDRVNRMASTLAEQFELMRKFMTMFQNTNLATTTPGIPRSVTSSPVTPPDQDLSPKDCKRKAPKIANPENFNGNKYKLELFVARCGHHFMNDPARYSTGRDQVMFAGSFMEGPAYSWFSELLRDAKLSPHNPPPELDSWEEFEQGLISNFGDPDALRNKERELRRLRQITSVAVYNAEFRRLNGFLKWDDRNLMGMYHDGLKEVIQDGIALVTEKPKTLARTMALALQLDNRQAERIATQKNNRPNFPQRNSNPTRRPPSRTIPPQIACNDPPPLRSTNKPSPVLDCPERVTQTPQLFATETPPLQSKDTPLE